MTIAKIITAICSFMFFMIGVDKFLGFLEPPCSLENYINPVIWKTLGVAQVAAGFLIWMPQCKKYIVGFFAVFMFIFTFIHITQGTYDLGGSAFMGILLAVLGWNPSFINGKKN